MARLVAINLVSPAHMAEEVWKAWDEGAAVLPLDPKAPSSVTARALATQRPETLISAAGTWTLHDPLPVWDDTAAVLLTSGTTGEPKGVELSHTALGAAARLTNARLEAAPADRWTCVLPLHHVAGFAMLPRSRSLGSDIEFLDPADVAALGEAGGQFVSLVPTQLRRALDRGVDLSRFKAVLLGGAAVPEELLAMATDHGVRAVRTYGMTETCGGVVYDGMPLDEVSVRVGESFLSEVKDSDAGPVALASPTLMSGYRGGHRKEDEWFDTNDIGVLGGGRLSVLGRADDVIITGGEKVMPRRVEEALAKHPSIDEVFVTGAPDAEWGQKVVAFLVGDGTVAEELAGFLGRALARHEVPKEFIFVTELPRNPGGKVDEPVLREKSRRIF